MSSLNPVGWWRLGESAGATVNDSSGNGHTGTYYNTPTYNETGAIIGDANTAVEFNGSNEYVEVPDHDDFSLTKGQDGFDRTVAASSNWGTADHGGTWSHVVSGGSYYSCSGGKARINQTGTAATWQQKLPVSRKDCDLQVRVSWDDAASGGSIYPLMLVARFQNTSNYYRAELKERVGGQLDLRITKVVSGSSTVLDTVNNVGTYSEGDWWYVRFQLEGTSLRAKAWKRISSEDNQPTSWQATATDSSITSAGTVGIRSSNSGSSSRPTVSFKDFRAQSVGMTVHVWMRPDDLDFSASNSKYLYFLGKANSSTDNVEWAFRFYKESWAPRPNRVSAYMWNRYPTGNKLGAGAYYQPGTGDMSAGTWYQFVAVFDPGDYHDTEAGVSLYYNGSLAVGPTSSGTLYRNPSSPSKWKIYPLNGSAPLRFATRGTTEDRFEGALDEIAIFDRKLTPTEISDLYDAAL